MKTHEELEQRVREMVDGFLDCELMQNSAVETGLCNGIRTVIAEIREGMVPVEDVRPLVEMLRDPAVGPTQKYRLLENLLVKHPKLFTI